MALAVINAPEPIQTTPPAKRALFSDGEHGKKLTPKRKTLASKVKKKTT